MPKTTVSCLKLLCLLFLVCASSLVCTSIVNGDGDQTANLPPRTIGDEWKFAVDYKGDVGMICNMTTTVTGKQTLPELSNYECYEFTSVGEGTIYGDDVSGTWSTTIKEYYGQSDFSLAKMILTQNANIVRPNGSSTTNQYTEATNNPPLAMNSGFPLSLGKTWSATTNTTQTDTSTVDNQTSQNNSTFTRTTNYLVASVDSTQTPAGTFTTYLIRGTAADGSIQEMYYAPDAHIQVKELDYNSAGNLIATMELLDYHVANPQNSPTLLWLAAAIIVVAIALSAIGFLTLKHRNPKTASASITPY
jgi:hypothetical protein